MEHFKTGPLLRDISKKLGISHRILDFLRSCYNSRRWEKDWNFRVSTFHFARSVTKAE